MDDDIEDALDKLEKEIDLASINAFRESESLTQAIERINQWNMDHLEDTWARLRSEITLNHLKALQRDFK